MANKLLQDLTTSPETTNEHYEAPSQLEEFAKMVNNWSYNYKEGFGYPTDVTYSGPMAQELLQVPGYEACVFENEEGILQIDQGRLAMTLAGTVADLAKKVQAMEKVLFPETAVE